MTAVWVLEAGAADPQGDRIVHHYSTTGTLLGGFAAPASAQSVHSESYSRSPELYVVHGGANGKPARVTVHGEDGALQREWDLPGEPRGLAISSGSSTDRPIYIVLAGEPGRAGRLMRYTAAGSLVWEKPLDIDPVAVSAGGRAVVAGFLPGAPEGDGRIIDVREDAQVLRTWPVEGFVPIDVVANGPGDTWVMGHPPGDAGDVSLRKYQFDGILLSACDRLPQPSVPTPAGTAACPVPTPGVVAWSYAASGRVAAVPAISADGTAYVATQRGLMYALDCAGGRKWLFDYRSHTDGWGPQAFEGAPAVDETGTIYVGDDIVVPNFFFALHPDGSVKWVQRYESLYSQIDASPALAADGHIFTAAHGWGAGVDHGAILVLHRDGRLLRPNGDVWSEDGTGPITNGPALLADGSAAYVSPPFGQWVLPTGTPPTATPEATHTTVPTRTPRPTRTRVAETPAPHHRAFLPRALRESRPPPAAAAHRPAVVAQPMPPPWIIEPVPSRLRLVRAESTADTVVDLAGLSAPSAPATDGRDIWFTALAEDDAHLLAYRGGSAPELRLNFAIPAGAAAAPVLGRRDAVTGRMVVLWMGTDGKLVALDASSDDGTAEVRWSRFIGLPAAGAPALGDDGQVYVAAGQVAQALDLATGDVRWSVPLASDASGSVNLARGGMLYVATQSGVIHAIGTSATGLDAQAAWPALRHDARNTGASGVGR